MTTRMFIAIVALVIFVWIGSAITHEADLSRNFKKYGDAKAFFFPIRVSDIFKEEK